MCVCVCMHEFILFLVPVRMHRLDSGSRVNKHSHKWFRTRTKLIQNQSSHAHTHTKLSLSLSLSISLKHTYTKLQSMLKMQTKHLNTNGCTRTPKTLGAGRGFWEAGISGCVPYSRLSMSRCTICVRFCTRKHQDHTTVSHHIRVPTCLISLSFCCIRIATPCRCRDMC